MFTNRLPAGPAAMAQHARCVLPQPALPWSMTPSCGVAPHDRERLLLGRRPGMVALEGGAPVAERQAACLALGGRLERGPLGLPGGGAAFTERGMQAPGEREVRRLVDDLGAADATAGPPRSQLAACEEVVVVGAVDAPGGDGDELGALRVASAAFFT